MHVSSSAYAAHQIFPAQSVTSAEWATLKRKTGQTVRQSPSSLWSGEAPALALWQQLIERELEQSSGSRMRVRQVGKMTAFSADAEYPRLFNDDRPLVVLNVEQNRQRRTEEDALAIRA